MMAEQDQNSVEMTFETDPTTNNDEEFDINRFAFDFLTT